MQDFYKDKRVLVTGHTGFKGSWLCTVLKKFGAEVTGYSMEPCTRPSLFELADVSDGMVSVMGDIRDLEHLKKVFEDYQPEIVFHLAAQPIVRESYKNPVYTYSTNVMGVVNIMECIRLSSSVKSFLNVTTDKVYKNNNWEWGYRENDILDGYDPYSNSKSCSELVTAAYVRSYRQEITTRISTARAGNVIGGGDFSKDRIIPDCFRAVSNGESIIVRNKYSIRPYQHVLEPLFAYMLIIMEQYNDEKLQDCYNVGPDDGNYITTGGIVDRFCKLWGNNAGWKAIFNEGPHEDTYLKLDCSKIKSKLKWQPGWNIDEALEKVVEWYQGYFKGKSVKDIMEKQISEFIFYRN